MKRNVTVDPPEYCPECDVMLNDDYECPSCLQDAADAKEVDMMDDGYMKEWETRNL